MKNFKFKIILGFFILTLVNSIAVGVNAMEGNKSKASDFKNVINEKEDNKEEKFNKYDNDDKVSGISEKTFSENDYNNYKYFDEVNGVINDLINEKSSNDSEIFNINKDKNVINDKENNKEEKFIKDNNDGKLSEMSKKFDEDSDDDSIKIFRDFDKIFNYSDIYSITDAKIFEYYNEFYGILVDLMNSPKFMISNIKQRYDSLCWRCNNYVEKNISKIYNNDLNILNGIINEIINRMEYPNYYNVKDKIYGYCSKFNNILKELMDAPKFMISNIKQKYDSLLWNCNNYVEKNISKISKCDLENLNYVINLVDEFIENSNNNKFYFKPMNYHNDRYYGHFNDKYEQEDEKFYYEILNKKSNNFDTQDINASRLFSFKINGYFKRFSNISSKFLEIVKSKYLTLDKKLYDDIEGIKKEYEELRKEYRNFVLDNVDEFFKNQDSRKRISQMNRKIGRAISKIYGLFPNISYYTEYFDSFYESHKSQYKNFVFYLMEFEKRFRKMLFNSLPIETYRSSLKKLIDELNKEYEILVKEYEDYIYKNQDYFNLNNELIENIYNNIFNFQKVIQENIKENEET